MLITHFSLLLEAILNNNGLGRFKAVDKFINGGGKFERQLNRIQMIWYFTKHNIKTAFAKTAEPIMFIKFDTLDSVPLADKLKAQLEMISEYKSSKELSARLDELRDRFYKEQSLRISIEHEFENFKRTVLKEEYVK